MVPTNTPPLRGIVVAMHTAYRIMRMTGVVMLAVDLVGCTSSSVDDEQDRSRIKSGLSFSAETNLFIQQLQSHRLTRQFTGGHKLYLAKLRQELASDKSTGTTPQTIAQLTIAEDQLNRLSEMIDNLPLSPE